jgi:hypothetical protein
MSRNNSLLAFVLALLVISLVTTLTPFSDIDNDGLLDSLVTEGLILGPGLLSVSGLVMLLTSQTSALLTVPRFCLTQFIPPPISN